MAHKNTYIDYTGIKFNKFTILGRAPSKNNRINKRHWYAKCDCGNLSIIETSRITSSQKAISCGKCIKYDLHGFKNKYVTVIEYSHRDDKRRSHKWKCQCACGNIRILDTTVIIQETYKNCIKCRPRKSILDNKYALKHGLTKHKTSPHTLYRMLNGMMTRCYNAKKSDYPYYQGKGIEIYKEWLDSPLVFYNWAINNGWQEGLTIDRIDPDDDYTPSNCRFVTRVENIRNACRYKKNKNYEGI